MLGIQDTPIVDRLRTKKTPLRLPRNHDERLENAECQRLIPIGPAIADLDAGGVARLTVPARGQICDAELLDRRGLRYLDPHGDKVVWDVDQLDVDQLLESGARRTPSPSNSWHCVSLQWRIQYSSSETPIPRHLQREAT